jgi:CHASE3 domain sensor protein
MVQDLQERYDRLNDSNNAKLEVIKKLTANNQKLKKAIQEAEKAIQEALDLLGDGQGLDKQDAIYEVIDILTFKKG